MPIDIGRVMTMGFAAFDAAATLAEVFANPAYTQANLIIVRFDNGKFAILQRADLDALRRQMESQGRGITLMDAALGSLTIFLAADPVFEQDDHPRALEKTSRSPGMRSIVLKGDGSPAGILFAGSTRSIFKADQQIVAAMASRVPEAESTHAPDDHKPETRYINVEVRDEHNTLYDARQQPLQRGQAYSLVFDIDLLARLTSAAATELQIKGLFTPQEDYVTLKVRLTSSDFDISAVEQPLFLPRRGKSMNQASFLVRPRRDGPAVIHAVILKDNNFVQALTLKFHVGELFTLETAGRPVEAAFTIPPRDVNITLLKAPDGFLMILTGAVAATAAIPLTLPQLDQMIAQLRKTLQSVVNMAENGVAVYQEGIEIPESVNRAASFRLASEGYRLYQRIFFGPAADQQCKNLGQKLRSLAQNSRLNIQIFSKEFLLPWGLLYLSDRPPMSESDVDPRLFLGFQHIIEQIPLQPGMEVLDSTIDARRGLSVGVNLNTDIDADMGINAVEEQMQYWARLAANRQATVVLRRSRDEVLRALANPETPDQIIYFYCHAVSRSLAEGDGPDASKLEMTGDQALTLGELEFQTSSDVPMVGQPLIFINACQSAELSPLFYDGFVPYFMSKGARGVIGAECDIPALFAKDWAVRFFDRLLAGQPLGEIVRDLRWEFFEKHHNLLGLFYAIYVDGDTHIDR